ncbi:hypothetical protein ACEPPN_005577 [Leptodophora sp. 'Broadleaf-Isolate-01']
MGYDGPATDHVERRRLLRNILRHQGSGHSIFFVLARTSMEIEANIQITLPTDLTERRRLQNRIAQRKFRQKKEQLLLSNAAQNDTPSTSSSSSIAASAQSTSSQFQPISANTGMSTSHIDQTDASYHAITRSPSLDDVNLWDLNTIDSLALLSGANTLDVDLTPPSTAQSSLASTTTLNHFLNYNRNSEALPPYPVLTPNNDYSLSQPHSSAQRATSLIPPVEGGWLTPLHIAAQKGHDRIVRVLIQRNVDCNEKDSDGRTPLIYAVIEDHQAVVCSLLAHGARINEVDCEQRSALHWAVLYRRERVLKILLEHYSEKERELDINGYNNAGWTPLHMAIERDFESGVLMLLQYGANLQSKARKSPLNARTP